MMHTFIQTKAKAFGVFASPHRDRMNVYVDPNHENEQYHSPKLTPQEAAIAHERGLIEDYDEKGDHVDTSDAVLPREPVDENALGRVGARRTEEFAAEDDKGGFGSGTLDSRQSTAFPDGDRVSGGASGYTDGLRTPPADVDADSGDEDAPPAAGGRKASGRASKAS